MFLPVIHQGVEVYLLYEIRVSGRTFTALFLSYAMSSSNHSTTPLLLHEHVNPCHVQHIYMDLTNTFILHCPLLCFMEPKDCYFYSVLGQSELEYKVVINSNEFHRVKVISNPALVTLIKSNLKKIEKIYLADGHHRWHALKQVMTSQEIYSPILLVSHADLNISAGHIGIEYSIEEVKFHAETGKHLAINSTIFTPKPLVDLIMYNIKTRVITIHEIFSKKFSETQASL